ncbi:MAG: PAS domain-containing protein [Deltaproteobacteria bacterium]|nr:PAS domain-containing protein [Deltaproteobacteria bacterium]
MPRRLFARLLLHGALALLALTAGGGFALDRFLAANEVDRLSGQVERYALLLKEDVSRTPAAEGLQAAVRRMGAAARIRFTVVDPKGVVLADSDRDPAAMENHATHPEVAEALAGRQGRSLRRSATLGIDMLYVAVPGQPVVRAAIPMADVQAIRSEVRQRLLLAAVPAGVVAFGLALLLARAVTRRVEGMIRFTSAVASGDFSGELHAGGDDELADMERGLVALRDEIRSRVEALGRERGTLSALVDGLPHAVFALDGARHLSLLNRPASALVRLSPEEAAGLPAAEVLREPRILAALDAVTADGPAPEPFPVSWHQPRADFEVLLRHLPDEGGRRGVLVVLRDVTREIHLERVRADFIANLSHELRTPLTAIRGSAETLLDSALGDPAAAVRFAETIRRNALRLESLLLDVSELSRVESGAEAVVAAPFDAREVATLVADLFAGEARKAELTLDVRLPEEPLPLVSDAGKVESILVNLVQNGLRYTPAGGRVTVSAEGGGGGVTYRVEDTGQGIPSRDLPRVTERFYRVDPGRSRAVGGTGLGLSIVKHLVELLGGTLTIESEHGAGTRVSVRLGNHA